jgi:hypothetical protein
MLRCVAVHRAWSWRRGAPAGSCFVRGTEEALRSYSTRRHPPPPCTPTQVVDGRTDIRLDTPIGRPFSVETASFKGLACLNMKGLPNTSGKCFEGKKRYIHLAFQVSPGPVGGGGWARASRCADHGGCLSIHRQLQAAA